MGPWWKGTGPKGCSIIALGNAQGLESALQKRALKGRPKLRAQDSGKPGCHFRVGIGNDLHRLSAGRKLILGGIQIPSVKGPVGHSDGDALAHALCDALLGATGLGDIGQHFPDTAAEWHNASSLSFLRHVRSLLEQAGYRTLNVDATVSLERPKLAAHIPSIRNSISNALGVAAGQVSVKAKTGEGLDAVGRGEAVRAEAIALVEKIDPD